MPALFAFLHHAAAFTLVACLVVEFVLVKPGITLQNARIVQRADTFYGIAVGIIIVVGVLRVQFFEKGPEYYAHSIPFIAKMSAFVIVGLLSIMPTIEFLRWRKQTRAGAAPDVAPEKFKTMRMLIHLELVGIAVILACAAMMARGIGEFH
ncbi:MAG: DUF2214 family protein [Alphaproteobacteria bacterium]